VVLNKQQFVIDKDDCFNMTKINYSFIFFVSTVLICSGESDFAVSSHVSLVYPIYCNETIIVHENNKKRPALLFSTGELFIVGAVGVLFCGAMLTAAKKLYHIKRASSSFQNAHQGTKVYPN
jgi:hypothetical protein